jgi:hypothetical protein
MCIPTPFRPAKPVHGINIDVNQHGQHVTRWYLKFKVRYPTPTLTLGYYNHSRTALLMDQGSKNVMHMICVEYYLVAMKQEEENTRVCRALKGA